MHNETLKICLLQLDLQWQNPAENRKHIETYWNDNKKDTNLLVLPEMFSTGFTMNVAECAETMQGETVNWMKHFSKKHNCLLIGSLIIKEKDQFYNRLLVVEGDEILAQYDKKHLFRMAKEQESYTAGKEKVVFTYKGWKICPMICYDLRFPVWSRNQWQGESAEYDLLLYVANWPQKRIMHWEMLLIARAIENQCYVAGVNRIGKDENEITYIGKSGIIDFMGYEVSYWDNNTEQNIFAELSKSALDEYRGRFPAWQDGDNFTLG